MREIYVGKNVVRILNREFPIDTNLSLLQPVKGETAWKVKSAKETHEFTPVQDGEVSAEAFRTYHHALASAITSKRSKLRELLGHKHEGVKIIPGHGVFILPAKMVAVQRGQREVGIRVFTGTRLSKVFRGSNYDVMVEEASDYYHKYVKVFTDEANQSLWYPVVRPAEQPRIFDGIEMPNGVFAYHYREGGVDVFFQSPAEDRTMFYGIARGRRELKAFIAAAAQKRHEELAGKAVYRYVTPSFVPLSSYMRKL